MLHLLLYELINLWKTQSAVNEQRSRMLMSRIFNCKIISIIFTLALDDQIEGPGLDTALLSSRGYDNIKIHSSTSTFFSFKVEFDTRLSIFLS